MVDTRIPLAGEPTNVLANLADVSARRDVRESNLATAAQGRQLRGQTIQAQERQLNAPELASIFMDIETIPVLLDGGKQKEAGQVGILLSDRLHDAGLDTQQWDRVLNLMSKDPASASKLIKENFLPSLRTAMPDVMRQVTDSQGNKVFENLGTGERQQPAETFATEQRDGVSVQVSSTTGREFTSPRLQETEVEGFTNVKQLPSGDFVGMKGGEIQVIPETEAAGALLESQGETKAPTSTQSLAAGFAQRTQDSGETITELGAEFTGFLSRGAALVPRGAQPENRQLFNQATRDFINATLRRESGAAIQQSEFDSARLQYIPQPGDGEAVLEQKTQNRQTISTALRLEAGPAFTNLQEELGAPEVEVEQTATNPQTGQVIFLRNDVWVDEDGNPV